MIDMSSLDRLSLEGKVAIVTGSTQGLGEAIARLFADRGVAGLVITGRNEANGERVKTALEAKGVKAIFVAADLAKTADAEKIVEAADKAFGRVDILVNAAGLTDRGTIWDTEPELFDLMFAVNRAGALLPDAARPEGDEAREDRRVDRQYHLDVRPWWAELHHRLLRLEGRADHADQKRRQQCHEPPHPRQRPYHRMDGYSRAKTGS